MDSPKVPPRSAASELAGLLDSPEVQRLVGELEDTRWTGRPGYPIRAMVGMALAKSMYAIPTWTRTVRLVSEHSGLQAALGCEAGVPSEWACYQFAAKLRTFKPLLDSCIAQVVGSLSAEFLDYGVDASIDASDLPAYADGQRYVSKGGRERAPEEFSDPDASWATARPCPLARAAASMATSFTFRLLPDGPSARVADRDGALERVSVRCPADRRGARQRACRGDLRDGQGLRP